MSLILTTPQHSTSQIILVFSFRCSGMDTQTKFIAMRLFEAINEAYEVFLENEGVS